MINLINSNNFNINQEFETDILIIGSGINCLSFIDFFYDIFKKKKRIIVIEKGDINKNTLINKRSDLSESINFDNIHNKGQFEFLSEGMNQSVSGNSSFWGGRFARLDEEDFIKRDWLIDDKEWPFSYQEYTDTLDKIYRYYNVSNLQNFDIYKYFSKKHLIQSENLENKVFFIKFINFFYILNKKNYIKNKFKIFYNAELESLEFENNRIKKVKVKNKKSLIFNLKAQTIILSAGVIGNIQNLLKLKKNNKIIDSKNIVGKYVMNHPGGKILDLDNKNRLFSSMYFGSNFFSMSYRYGVKGTFNFQKNNKITNSLLLFQPYYSINKFKLSETSNWLNRKFLGNFDKKIILNLYCEMLPNISNKIEFIDNKLNIHINLDKILYQNMEILIRELLNFFIYDNKKISEIINNIKSKKSFEDSYHYMGGTIMGFDKSKNVVNQHLKHHEVDNLYILGASTFPKSGHANPVATQLFLSYRLASHLF